MEREKNGFKTIDDYIETFPKHIQEILENLRAIIKASAPDAEEKISYQMPTFALSGNIVHFAAYKNHIGFYPTPSGIQAFKKELSIYECSKGTIRFPIDKPIPYKLITKIVLFRVKENRKKKMIQNLGRVNIQWGKAAQQQAEADGCPWEDRERPRSSA